MGGWGKLGGLHGRSQAGESPGCWVSPSHRALGWPWETALGHRQQSLGAQGHLTWGGAWPASNSLERWLSHHLGEGRRLSNQHLAERTRGRTGCTGTWSNPWETHLPPTGLCSSAGAALGAPWGLGI